MSVERSVRVGMFLGEKSSSRDELERGERERESNVGEGPRRHPSHGAPWTWRPFAVRCTNNHIADGFVSRGRRTGDVALRFSVAADERKKANVRKVDISDCPQTAREYIHQLRLDTLGRLNTEGEHTALAQQRLGDEKRSLRWSNQMFALGLHVGRTDAYADSSPRDHVNVSVDVPL